MANGMYKDWLKPENLILLQGWKRDGLTDEEIARNIGINVRTLSKWKVRYGQIGQALKVGKQQANFIIENKLFEKARKGNTTAMIFWLKNNWRDKYNDSQLSVEERNLARKRTEKIEAETEIAKARAKLLSDENNNGITQIVFNDDMEPDNNSDKGDEDSGNET